MPKSRPARTFLAALFTVVLTAACCARQLAPDDKFRPTFAGYVDITKDKGSAVYYAYYEATSHKIKSDERPILVWLQGGPGCASSWGAFYEVGPYSLGDLGVIPNPGAWNRLFGLLVIDQPIGTGYSVVGLDDIPADDLAVASHLYTALQGFYSRHSALQPRPLYITGESYGGKYIPSIAHFILQASRTAAAAASSRHPPPPLRRTRPLPPNTPPPLFKLHGIAIGNGFTAPRTQTLMLADVAYHLGLISDRLREVAGAKQLEVVELIDTGEWEEAHTKRENLIKYLQDVTGAVTLLDIRRYSDYDGNKKVDAFLDMPWVKKVMNASQQVTYEGCSKRVGKALSGDVMRSVTDLVPDLLEEYKVLLYQGQFDAQDGPASNHAWIDDIDWPHRDTFNSLEGGLWHAGGHPAGWSKSYSSLTQVVVRNAGHMVPHDVPLEGQVMIEGWVLQPAPQASRPMWPRAEHAITSF